MLLNLVVILIAMFLSWAAAGEARAQSLLEDLDRTPRRLERGVTPSLPLPAATLTPPGKPWNAALRSEPQSGSRAVSPVPSLKQVKPDSGKLKHKSLDGLVDRGRLLLAKAGLNFNKGLLTAARPLGHGIAAYVALKPIKGWGPSWVEEPTRKTLSAGVYLPLSRGSAATGDNLSLRVSTGVDLGMRPAVFFTLTTSGPGR